MYQGNLYETANVVDGRNKVNARQKLQASNATTPAGHGAADAVTKNWRNGVGGPMSCCVHHQSIKPSKQSPTT